jgi:hypothetical protein
MEHKIYKEVNLKTPRDFRGLANEIDNAMRKISELEYGFYKIDKKDKHILIMIECMLWFQEQTNKGVKIIGSMDVLKMEIYDYKKVHDEIRESFINLYPKF